MADTNTNASRLGTFQCHFTWQLEDNFTRDFKTAMGYIDHHLKQYPDEMRVPAMAVKAYLYASNLQGNNTKMKYKTAKDAITEALKRNKDDSKKDPTNDGYNGYKVVLLADLAWLQHKTRERNVETCITEVQELQASLSKDAQAYMQAMKAFTFQKFGISKYTEGISCYEEALRVVPSNVEWFFGYTQLLQKTSYSNPLDPYGTSKVERNLRCFISKTPKNGLAHVYLAEELLQNGKDSHLEAEYEVEQALESGGENVVVLQRAGKVFCSLKKYDKALELYDRALAVENEASYTLRLIGDAYRYQYFDKPKAERAEGDKQHLENAITYYKRAYEADRSNFRAHSQMASLYSVLDQRDEAEEVYSQLIDTPNKENKAEALFHFAEFRDDNTSITLYKEAVGTDVDSYHGKRAAKKLIEKMQSKLTRNPNRETFEMLGWVYTKTGFIDSACFHYQEAYKMEQTEELELELSKLYVESVNPDQACKYLELIKDSNPEEYRLLKGKLHLSLGVEFKDQGMTDKAREQFSLSTKYESLEGCEKLAELLQNCTDDEKYDKRWITDWAKITSVLQNEWDLMKKCQDKVKESRLNSLEEIREKTFMPKVQYLHDLYNNFLELRLKPGVDKYGSVLIEARSLLDRVMSGFQKMRYSEIKDKKTRYTFFYIKDPKKGVKKDENYVYMQLQKRLEGEYKWNGFRGEFPDLFDALIKVQPAYDFTENKKMIFLFEIVNKYKHRESLKDGIQELKIDGEKYNFTFEELTEWSVSKVIELVQCFDKHM